MRKIDQPWIYSARADLCWIIAPPFVASGVVLLVPGFFEKMEGVPPWAWLVLVLGIDVAHVYGTLFKTYLDPKIRRKRLTALMGIPILGWCVGAALYSMGELTFWRALAYLAVFHFIRQQYGFVRVYSRKETGAGDTTAKRLNRWLDTSAVYLAMIYPLLYWHTHLPRKFNWFMDGDFFGLPPWVGSLAGWIFAGVESAFLVRELYRLVLKPRHINIPKDLIVLGTVVSWYVGIVVFNGDMAFTLVNVVSHGIPYLALVWFTERTKKIGTLSSESKKVQAGHSRWPGFGLATFCAVLLTCAYLEETLWDALVWRDHPSIFAWSYWAPLLTSPWLLTWVVPFLSLPQITHYLLDGMIWKVRDPALQREFK